MADKDRIAELDKAIKDTRAELAAIQREKQTACLLYTSDAADDRR